MCWVQFGCIENKKPRNFKKHISYVLVCFDIWFPFYNVLLCNYVSNYIIQHVLCAHDSYRLSSKEICQMLRKKRIERNNNCKISWFIGNIFHNFYFFLISYFLEEIYLLKGRVYFGISWFVSFILYAIGFLIFCDCKCTWDCYIILWFHLYFLNAKFCEFSYLSCFMTKCITTSY